MIKLSETSGLVLHWTSENTYCTKNAKEHLAKLDLSSSEAFRDRCEAGFEECATVIQNRKFGILRMSTDIIPQHNIKHIIIAGAGLDAMGIELKSLYPACEVYELDNENMELKSNLSGHTGIHFLNANLGDIPKTIELLMKAGWKKEEETLLILEGITYYLPEPLLSALTKAIDPQSVAADILKFDEMTEEAKLAGDHVFNEIQTACGLPPATRYSVKTLSETLNMPMEKHWPMTKLETERTGKSEVFLEFEDSPIDMACYTKA